MLRYCFVKKPPRIAWLKCADEADLKLGLFLNGRYGQVAVLLAPETNTSFFRKNCHLSSRKKKKAFCQATEENSAALYFFQNFIISVNAGFFLVLEGPSKI